MPSSIYQYIIGIAVCTAKTKSKNTLPEGIIINCMNVTTLLNVWCSSGGGFKNCETRNKQSPLFRLNLLVELYESIRSRDELDCGLRRREELSHEDILYSQDLNTETVTGHNHMISSTLHQLQTTPDGSKVL
jgi:hypothetical protein